MAANEQVIDAQEALYDNTADLPRYPWADLDTLVGPPIPGDLTVIGARPANGKTTFMLNLFDHFVRAGFPTLYIGAGSEGPPRDLRRQWSALRLGYPSYLVMENRWSELPPGPARGEGTQILDSRGRVFADLEWQAQDYHNLAFFADAGERLTPTALVKAMSAFKRHPAARYVLLDHIHRIRFGTDKNPRLELAEATRWLRDMAAKYSWGIIVAAQLHRAPSQQGTLRDLIPPTMSDLKETGTLEEDAVVGLLLHRVKRPDLDGSLVNAVARGERPMADILEPGCMAVRIGKHRRRGHVMDSTAFLQVHDSGRLENRAPVWRSQTAPPDVESRYGI
jgi:replicative DNA helicase